LQVEKNEFLKFTGDEMEISVPFEKNQRNADITSEKDKRRCMVGIHRTRAIRVFQNGAMGSCYI
jgi:hypothetical protein